MKHTIITASVIVIILVISGYYFLTRDVPTGLFDEFPLNISTTEAKRESPEGWSEYRSERYIFSLFYPEGMTVKEFDEGGGASTFIFENVEKGLGFQIFVVPYGGTQIAEDRFLKDVPSGIRENLSGLYLDGVLATSFDSKSIELGDTWEVWFIHKGLLYEMTTFRGQKTWLSEIIKTWRFI